MIAGKRSSAVLLSADDWQLIQKTLYLLSVPGMRESIKKGMTEPLAKCAKEQKSKRAEVLRWQVVLTKHALKDAKKLAAASLRGKAQDLLRILSVDLFQNPPPFEKWVGDLEGTYSRRVNIPQRLVDEVFKKEHIVRVLPMRTGYK